MAIITCSSLSIRRQTQFHVCVSYYAVLITHHLRKDSGKSFSPSSLIIIIIIIVIIIYSLMTTTTTPSLLFPRRRRP